MTELITVLTIHSIWFLIALVLIVRSPYGESKQRWMQILFSVVLIIVGPLYTIFVLGSDLAKPTKIRNRPEGSYSDVTSLIALNTSPGFDTHGGNFGHASFDSSCVGHVDCPSDAGHS
jgi:hypothetical protein